MISGNNWTVYVHVNKINGKRYVGITSRPPEVRWRDGTGYISNPRFYSAIKKYGWDGFEHIILKSGLSEEDAKGAERLFIKEWHTQDLDCGYNLTSGGEGTRDCHPSEETRRKLSEARRRENLSDETLRRRSAGLKGRVFSDEHKRKIGESNSKPVEMYDTNGVLIKTFPSAHCAEVELSISHSHISQCCHNNRRTAGGYAWQFAQTA